MQEARNQNIGRSVENTHALFWCGLLLAGCVAIMLAGRVFGPSALQRFDQPRTVSYTADVALNGRWLLPRDMMGRTASKPPLVNWLAVPIVKLGFWTEWAVKLPMVGATLVSTALTVWMARRLFQQIRGMQGIAFCAACIAGIAWIANPANTTMVYHCRPDPVLVMFVTAGWILGTIVVCEKGAVSAAALAGFWVSVGLAALTKGPAALVPVIYLPLAARLIGGRWSLVHRSRWWWGLPLALGVFLAWAVPTAVAYPDPFFNVLVRQQFVAHALGLGEQFGNTQVTSEGPIAALKLINQNPVWFFQRFAPWSLLSIGALCVIGWRQWFRHPLAPAVLWTFLVLVFFAFSAHKTADYILAAYPAAAILAAYFCATFLRRFGVRLWQVGCVGLVLAFGFGARSMYFSNAAKYRAGENLKEFARNIDNMVRDDPVVFLNTGYNTLQFFLHRHQPGRPTSAQIKAAKWAILPLQADIPAEMTSKPVPRMQARLFTLGLYRIETVRPRLMQMIGTEET